MKHKIYEILKKAVDGEVNFSVEVPEKENFGHYSANAAMILARKEKKPPYEVAVSLVSKIKKIAPSNFFEKIEIAGAGFINFWLTKEAIQKEFGEVLKDKSFSKSKIGKGETIIVEYSQPNIAKKMHVGHLRATVMGDALANVYEFLGYKVIRWNYIGDWGTQFGKLISAYKLWGNESEVKKNPIETLQNLYVLFHDEAKNRPELEDRGREEFKKLEEGDKENLRLWEWFREESLKEFKNIYDILGVNFDEWIGESFFEPQMKPLVKELLDKGIAKFSEGAVIIDLEKFNLPPALIQKSDGASLYLTRDIANLKYRLEKYKPLKILYVVGNEQSLHFEQLFKVAEILGLARNVELKHIKYGLVLAEEGKKFATREGRSVLLDEVINKAIKLAYDVVSQKNKELSEEEKKEVAAVVAVGALKYVNLRENPRSDIRFDWGKMLDFKGDSAPYLQYTYARLRSILRKAGQEIKVKGEGLSLDGEDELRIMRKTFEFSEVVQICAENYLTNALAKYLYELANLANSFYESTPILSDENEERKSARLALIEKSADILKVGMSLLGVKTLEKI